MASPDCPHTHFYPASGKTKFARLAKPIGKPWRGSLGLCCANKKKGNRQSGMVAAETEEEPPKYCEKKPEDKRGLWQKGICTLLGKNCQEPCTRRRRCLFSRDYQTRARVAVFYRGLSRPCVASLGASLFFGCCRSASRVGAARREVRARARWYWQAGDPHIHHTTTTTIRSRPSAPLTFFGIIRVYF